MQTHAKKKVEIIVERVIHRRIIDAIEQAGATGYTVLPGLAGKGHQGERGAADVLGALDIVMIIVIAGDDTAGRIVDTAMALLKDHTGIVYLSDVAVVRADHF